MRGSKPNAHPEVRDGETAYSRSPFRPTSRTDRGRLVEECVDYICVVPEIGSNPEIHSKVPPGERIQVVLRWGASEDDAAWRAAARKQFEAAYAADDSVDERLADPDSNP